MHTQILVNILLFLCSTAIPLAVYASGEGGPGVTSGRLWSLLPAVIGIFSIVMGGRALRSTKRTDSRKGGARLALLAGLACILLGLLHIIRSTGGIGTGSGILGTMVAMLLGTIGMLLGGIARSRSSKQASNTDASQDNP